MHRNGPPRRRVALSAQGSESSMVQHGSARFVGRNAHAQSRSGSAPRKPYGARRTAAPVKKPACFRPQNPSRSCPLHAAPPQTERIAHHALAEQNAVARFPETMRGASHALTTPPRVRQDGALARAARAGEYATRCAWIGRPAYRVRRGAETFPWNGTRQRTSRRWKTTSRAGRPPGRCARCDARLPARRLRQYRFGISHSDRWAESRRRRARPRDGAGSYTTPPPTRRAAHTGHAKYCGGHGSDRSPDTEYSWRAPRTPQAPGATRDAPKATAGDAEHGPRLCSGVPPRLASRWPLYAAERLRTTASAPARRPRRDRAGAGRQGATGSGPRPGRPVKIFVNGISPNESGRVLGDNPNGLQPSGQPGRSNR